MSLFVYVLVQVHSAIQELEFGRFYGRRFRCVTLTFDLESLFDNNHCTLCQVSLILLYLLTIDLVIKATAFQLSIS